MRNTRASVRVSESFVSDRVGKNRKISLWSGNKNSLGCFHTCAGIALTKRMGGRAFGGRPESVFIELRWRLHHERGGRACPKPLTAESAGKRASCARSWFRPRPKERELPFGLSRNRWRLNWISLSKSRPKLGVDSSFFRCSISLARQDQRTKIRTK